MRVAWLGSGLKVNASLDVTKLSDMLMSLPGILKIDPGFTESLTLNTISPERSFCLSSKESSSSSLELCRGHAHGFLHLCGGGRYEVLVNVPAQSLLSQHSPNQLNGRTDRLLGPGHVGTEGLEAGPANKTE